MQKKYIIPTKTLNIFFMISFNKYLSNTLDHLYLFVGVWATIPGSPKVDPVGKLEPKPVWSKRMVEHWFDIIIPLISLNNDTLVIV